MSCMYVRSIDRSIDGWASNDHNSGGTNGSVAVAAFVRINRLANNRFRCIWATRRPQDPELARKQIVPLTTWWSQEGAAVDYEDKEGG